MKKISMLLSTLVLAAMVLAACGGGATSTNVAGSPPPVTMDATEAVTDVPTDAATEVGGMTETPGIPVTGDVNPARLSNQLDFTVWSQDGEQIGEVDDMVLDLDNSQVAYVAVGTGGFLDLGERTILVPWESLQLQTGSGDTTGGQQNAFILQSDLDTFRNAPDFDLNANLPQMGQPAADWDVDVRSYWQGGGTGTDSTSTTPDANATATTGTGATDTDQATATAGTGTTGTDQSTATAGTGAGGTGTDQGTGGPATALQGVVLASEVLGSTITVTGQGNEGQGQGQDQSQATATTGTDQATATAGTGTTGTDQSTATAGTGTGGTGTDQGLGNEDVTIDDMIIAADTGEIQYIVVNMMGDQGERWIPVPLSLVQWNAGNGAFVLNSNPAVLRDAPFFQDGQFPDTTTSGWNSDFDTYWQNNGGTGATGTGTDSGTGAQATATP